LTNERECGINTLYQNQSSVIPCKSIVNIKAAASPAATVNPKILTGVRFKKKNKSIELLGFIQNNAL